MKKLLYISLTLTSLVSLTMQSCQEAEVEIKKDEKFCLTDTLNKNIEFSTTEVRTVENELVLQGKINVDEDKVAKVYPLVGGFVQELRANLGDYVQKGQVLAIIRSPEIAGFANQNSIAQSNLRVAEKNYQVAQELYKTGTTSEVEMINAKKDLETAQAELNRSREILTLYNVGKASYYNILSPASGYVISKDISLNMELRTEDVKPVFTISNLDNVWVMVNIYESDIDKVKEGYEAEISTISYPDKIFKGQVDKIYNMLDEESKVLKARIILNNPDYMLKPEMFANVSLRYRDQEEKLSVPTKAVIFDKNKYFVMVFKDRCRIETREIDIYKQTTTLTYLKGGLDAGEKVISKYHLLVYDALND
ncbi:MAG: efflux RND transporter periplasmic adaptor subunit [Microscillaceae bacterium]|nr:efflux RND transporter periplasmic adaptor subunit [Microscillaceae bacterium]